MPPACLLCEAPLYATANFEERDHRYVHTACVDALIRRELAHKHAVRSITTAENRMQENDDAPTPV